MTDGRGQFDKDGRDWPPAFSDEAIHRFLLSGLSGPEQARFAESLFGNEDLSAALEERVRAAECELADDYAFGRLSTSQRELFEKKFLVTQDRQRKLEVSTALRKHLAAEAASKRGAVLFQQGEPTARERILSWLGLNRPVLGFAVAVALLVMFGVVVWLALKSQRAPAPRIAKIRPVVVATPENNHASRPAPTAEVTASPKPTPKADTPAEPAPAAVVATFLLLPNAVRDGGQMTRVTLPQGQPGEHTIVRLQLALEVDEPGSHSAELLTAEGVSVYLAHKLQINSGDKTAQVTFDVPARLLKSGDYQVKLNWVVGGSVTSGGRYYFRVTQ